ncbi:hypothetical protein [Halioglobus maricola]|uniref:hypothetical protein n=1 Tax=Halioglobus maricola TaxID=2601894 RepID=UPI001292CE39|nr:hypothetical protein [Halioglobus maricola]
MAGYSLNALSGEGGGEFVLKCSAAFLPGGGGIDEDAFEALFIGQIGRYPGFLY